MQAFYKIIGKVSSHSKYYYFLAVDDQLFMNTVLGFFTWQVLVRGDQSYVESDNTRGVPIHTKPEL